MVFDVFTKVMTPVKSDGARAFQGGSPAALCGGCKQYNSFLI